MSAIEGAPRKPTWRERRRFMPRTCPVCQMPSLNFMCLRCDFCRNTDLDMRTAGLGVKW